MRRSSTVEVRTLLEADESIMAEITAVATTIDGRSLALEGPSHILPRDVLDDISSKHGG